MKEALEKIKSLEMALNDLKQHFASYDMREAGEALEKEEGIEKGEQSFEKTANPDMLKKQLLLKKMQSKEV